MMRKNKLLIRMGIVLFLSLTLIVSGGTSSIASPVDIDSSTDNIDVDDDKETDQAKLVIATRHDANIRQLYAEEFANSELGASVGITSADDIEYHSPTTYEGFTTLIKSDRIDVDIGWGGGPTLFNNLQKNGFLEPMTSSSLVNWIDANVSDTIAGASMKSNNSQDQLMWVAAAISSFGFTVNNKTLKDRGLPFPETWQDLAHPDFFTSISEVNIGMGNAPDTTSNTRIYQIILQKFGWEKGWEILYAMGANSGIYRGSVETRASVINGETAVAMTIDFYGLIAQAANPNTQYVIPKNGSIVNGDPISKTVNGSNSAAANAFIKFVLSKKGQSLWLDENINRLPVREDAFDTTLGQQRSDVKSVYDQTLANKGIEFNESKALTKAETMRYHFQYTITDVHTDLREAWAKIVNNYEQDTYPIERLMQIREILGEPAITEDQAIQFEDQILDSEFRSKKAEDWQNFAINKHTRAEDAIDDEYTITQIKNGTTLTNSSSPTTTAGQGFRDIDFSYKATLLALFTLPVLIYKKREKLRSLSKFDK